MVDDEVEGWPVAGRLRQVLWVAVLRRVIRGRCEALVDADVAERGPLVPQNDLVLPDQLERRIHDLLVVEPPLLHRLAGRIRDLFGSQGHAVAFPRVRFVVVDLPLDLEQVRRARVKQPVSVETLGARQLVDEISHAGRLVGRQDFDAAGIEHVLRLWARHEHGKKSGDVTEQTYGHLAVQEQRLDERLQMEDLGVHRVADQRRAPVSPETFGDVDIAAQGELVGQRGRPVVQFWIERIRVELCRARVSLRERPQPAIRRRVALADHVQLVVEDEEVGRRTVRRKRLALVQRVAAHVEVAPEDLVHRQERGGHASGGRHELPAAHAELLGGGGGELVRARLDALLLLGLRHRHPLAVRHDLSGNG